jgi:hypothetical protein
MHELEAGGDGMDDRGGCDAVEAKAGLRTCIVIRHRGRNLREADADEVRTSSAPHVRFAHTPLVGRGKGVIIKFENVIK